MYDIVYADPPWQYGKGVVSPSRDVSYKYTTMAIEHIENLRVGDIANKNSLLFLWTTCPFLPEAIGVMEKWGYSYKTIAFNWIKRNKIATSLFWGGGSWTRANSELCLLGVRGRPKRVSASVHQVVYEPVGEHSSKPNTVRSRIVELCGDVPRVELFARRKEPGWDAFGFDVDGFSVEDSIAKVVSGKSIQ